MLASPGGLILFREFAVSALREVLAPRGIKLPVTFLAKTKTTLQLVALGALMILWFWPAWRIAVPLDDLRIAWAGRADAHGRWPPPSPSGPAPQYWPGGCEGAARLRPLPKGTRS